jgi:hypothetical protein
MFGRERLANAARALAARGRAGLSGQPHPSRRHRQQPADRDARRRRHIQMERLSDQGARSPKNDDAFRLRVRPPLTYSRPAERLPSQVCSPAALARKTSPGCASCSRRPRRTVQMRLPTTPLQWPCSSRRFTPMPMLRRPQHHRRDVRSGSRLEPRFPQSHQDPHVMIDFEPPPAPESQPFSPLTFSPARTAFVRAA